MVAPLLFLLLFGVVEFGRVVATYTGVTTAAREGARFGSTVGEIAGVAHYLDCAGIKEATKDKAVMVALDDADIVVEYDNGPGTAVDAACDGAFPAPTADLVESGDRIIVTVQSTFDSPIPLISNLIGTLDIESEQARTLFKGVING